MIWQLTTTHQNIKKYKPWSETFTFVCIFLSWKRSWLIRFIQYLLEVISEDFSLCNCHRYSKMPALPTWGVSWRYSSYLSQLGDFGSGKWWTRKDSSRTMILGPPESAQYLTLATLSQLITQFYANLFSDNARILLCCPHQILGTWVCPIWHGFCQNRCLRLWDCSFPAD
jgi:hypothetical protein